MTDQPEVSLEDALRLLMNCLIQEVDKTLDSNDWALVKLQNSLPKAYAAAALRHCVTLLEDIYHASEENRETTSRILSRAHFESWLVGMYLALAEDEALDALASDYSAKANAWKSQLTEYNNAIEQRKKAARKRNKGIRKSNAHRAIRNERYSDKEPLPILAEVPLPNKEPLQFQIEDVLAGASTDVPPRDLVLKNTATRVDQLLEQTGSDLTVEAIYIVAYRSMSTFVSHPSLPVLDSYLSRDDRFFLRINKESNQATEPHAFTRSALHMTAILARFVFRMRGSPTPVSDCIDELFLPKADSSQSNAPA